MSPEGILHKTCKLCKNLCNVWKIAGQHRWTFLSGLWGWHRHVGCNILWHLWGWCVCCKLQFVGLWEWFASWYVATFLCFAIIYFNGVRCEPVEPPHLDWNYLEVGFLRCLGAPPPSNWQNRLELRNTPQTAIRCCYQYSEIILKKHEKNFYAYFIFVMLTSIKFISARNNKYSQLLIRCQIYN